MITSILMVLVLSVFRAVRGHLRAQYETATERRVKLAQAVTGHATSAATCLVVLVWGFALAAVGLP